MPVWETLLLDAAGTAVSGVTLGLAAWLAHRKGWLGRPLGALAGWLRANAPAFSAELVAVLTREVHHGDVLQGDAGFRETPAGMDGLAGADRGGSGNGGDGRATGGRVGNG